MATTAFQTQYRQEFIQGFEQRGCLLRGMCTTESVIKGNSAVFLVADSGGATAVTRGVNGLIPDRSDNLTQNTATMTEKHDLSRRTGFNVFASQGDARRIMQETSMGVVNRSFDDEIITELATGTVDTSTAATGSTTLVLKAQAILGLADVDVTDGSICALISPAMRAYLLQDSKFTSVDFVNSKELAAANNMFRWAGITFVTSNRLPGKGTNAEKCFLFHKSAIGHAVGKSDIQTFAGYDEEQDYSFARTSLYSGAKLLQNSGVVVINHDGSAYVGA